jgi:ankyrin repeat protein
MKFEKSRAGNNDMVNNDKTLLKYSNSCISRKKFKMNFEKSRACNKPVRKYIELANRHGHTCLMISCYKGHIEIAQLLLDAGADPNRKSVKGNTALHDCAESGCLAIIQLLIERGAKMDVDAYGILIFCLSK